MHSQFSVNRGVRAFLALVMIAAQMIGMAVPLPIATAQGNQPPTPALTASKTDTLTDTNGNSKADPNESIRYQVDLQNGGTSAAETVEFNDTIDPNTTLTANSLRVSPLAFNETYNAARDTALNVNTASGLLANDYRGVPDASVTAPSGPTTTSQGGSVTVNTDGSFLYTPAAGFTGTDSFSYTLGNVAGSDSGTVFIQVDAAPSVSSFVPASSSVIPTNQVFTVNFSEQVNFSAASFSLTCGGSPIAFTPSTSPATSATITPSTALAEGASCTLTVIAANVTDVDTDDPPNTMAADASASYTVDTAPSVTDVTPTDGSTGVALNASVSFTFSEVVNFAANSFTFTCNSTPIAFNLTTSPANIATLTPTANLPANVSCTVSTVAANISDSDPADPPNTLTADVSTTFTTLDTAPSVISTDPTNGAAGVALQPTITVNFSEAVNFSVSSFSYVCNSTPVAFTVSGDGTATAQLNTTNPLLGGESCTVTVIAANVSDMDSNDPPDTMAADFNFGFTILTTAPNAVDDTFVTTSSPFSNTTSILSNDSLGNPPATLTAPAEGVPTATAQGGSVVINSAGMGTFTYTAPVGFAGTDSFTYTITNSVGSDTATVFITVEAAPTVISTIPNNGDVTIATNAIIILNFSEQVNFSASSFTLVCGTSQTFSVNASPATSAILTPSTLLPEGTLCTVTALAAAISDVDLNDPPDNMPADYVFSFTTDAAPTVTSTVPTNGASDVPTNTTITVNFSELVNFSLNSFQLTCNSIPQTFSLSSSPNISATLTPSEPLLDNANCVVIVVSSQISDFDAGDPPDNLSSFYIFSFNTDAAPRVTNVTPSEGAVVANNTTITVTFSESVNFAANSFDLTCNSTPIPFSLSSSPSSSATITPNTALTNGANCTFTVVAANISDVDSNDPPDTMWENFIRNFAVDAAPSVSSTDPAEGTTNPRSNNSVTVTFSESVNFSASSFTYTCGGSPVAFTVSSSPAVNATLTPSGSVNGNLACVITVIAAQISDTDLIDPPDNMVADFTLNFTSYVAAPDALNDTYQTNSDTQLTINIASLGILNNDNRGVPPATITSPALGTPVATSQGGTITLAADGTFVYNTPSGFVGIDTISYTITNLAGSDSATITFVVEDAPTVISTVPTSDATNVPTNTTITINFSEQVNFSASSFNLFCDTGFITFTLNSSPATSAVLTPTSALPEGVSCGVTVVAALITDTDLNDPPDTMQANYSFGFSTDAAPTVTTTVPTNGANDVPTNTTITVNFSESVNFSTSSFQLTCDSVPQAFSVSASPATSATLTPSALLTDGANCVVTVVGSQISDADAGDPPDNLSGFYIFSFNTDAAPKVTEVTPSEGAVVANNAIITVTFSESVNFAANSFDLTCGGSPITFSLSSSPSTSATLTPTAVLTNGASCVLTVVAANVTDVDSFDPPNTMAANFTRNFAVDAAPTVTNLTPTNGATGVLPNATINVTFSELVNLTASAVTLTCDSTPISLSGLPASNVSNVTLTPAAALSGSCTVTVVATQVTDADTADAPDAMEADVTSTFSVETAPTVTNITPAEGVTVANNTVVTVTFSEPVNFAGNSFTLLCGGAPQSFSLSSSPSTAATITPNAPLPNGSSCVFTVVAANVTDVDSFDPPDTLESDVTRNFSVDAEPAVNTVVPTNGATDVAVTSPVTITFSESVNFSAASFSLVCGGSPITFSLSSAPSSTAVLTPDANLPTATTCNLTVIAANVSDEDAIDPPNTMTADFNSSFTTLDVAPSVTSTTPDNGATGVLETTNITIVFSEPVNVTASGATLVCNSLPVAFTGLPASGVTQIVLDPTTNLAFGASCTLTVVAVQVSDVDLVDPPNNMAADYIATFTVREEPPTANNDSFGPIVGNIGMSVPDGANDLFANDILRGGTLTAFDATSAQGGNVTVNADGSFSYNPPAGYEGVDTFTYTISNSGGASVGTVTITVNEVVWFVDNSGANGSGRYGAPFNSFASLTADEADDVIFVYTGSSLYGTRTLQSGQRLVGQGVSLSSALAIYNITLSPFQSIAGTGAGTRPSLDALTLASTGNNDLRGLTFAGTLFGISGSPSGNITITDVSVSVTGTSQAVSLGNFSGTVNFVNSTISGQNGLVFYILVGSGTVNFTNTPVSSSGSGLAVRIRNMTNGTVTFDANSPVTTTQSGIEVRDNTGNTTVSFNAPITLTTTAGRALTFANNTSGVTLTVTGGSIATTNAIALEVNDAGTANITLTSLSASGGNYGILWGGVSGSLTVNGIGNTAGSGGTIQNMIGYGAIVGGPSVFTLKNINFTNAASADGCAIITSGSCQAALSFNNAPNVTLNNVRIQNATGDHGIYLTNIPNSGNITFTDLRINNAGSNNQDSGIAGYRVGGTLTINESVGGLAQINTFFNSGIRILNDNEGVARNLTFNLSHHTFTDDNGTGAQAIYLETAGSSSITLSITNNSFVQTGSGLVLVNNSSMNNATITGNQFTNLANIMVEVRQGSGGMNNLLIQSNEGILSIGQGVVINSNNSGNVRGSILNNTLSGVQSRGIALSTSVLSSSIYVRSQGNSISLASGASHGIYVQSAVGGLETAIVNNQIGMGGTTAATGIRVENTLGTVCADITSNTTLDNAQPGSSAISMSRGSASIFVTGYLGGPLSDYLTSINNIIGGTVSTIGTFGSAPCTNVPPPPPAGDLAQGDQGLSAPPAGETVTVNIPQIPAGKSVRIIFDVTVNSPAPVAQVCNQANISGTNFSPLLTNDPDTAAPNDATCTNVATPIYTSVPAPNQGVGLTGPIGTPQSANIAVTNTGDPGTTLNVTLVSNSNNAFTIGGLPLSVNQGAPAQNITVSCTPDGTLRTGTLTVQSNEPTSPQYTYNLTCGGLSEHPGIYRPSSSLFALRNSLTGGPADIVAAFGAPGDRAIVGDWNADGVDTVGVYRNGNVFLRNSNTGGAPEISYLFGGDPRDVPIAGDWNGDGTDTIGLFRPFDGLFMLRNSNTSGLPDAYIAFGAVGDTPLAGDWDGNGTDTVGVHRGAASAFYLTNTGSGAGVLDYAFVFGSNTDLPVVGDWDGDSGTDVGVVRNGTWYLRNSLSDGLPEITFLFGDPTDEPLAGRWVITGSPAQNGTAPVFVPRQ